jgi:hypothetical protein
VAHPARAGELQAGVSLREMIPLAYVHGLQPKVAPAELEGIDEQLSRL